MCFAEEKHIYLYLKMWKIYAVIYKKLREEQQEKVDSFARMLYELLKALGE